MCRGVKMDENLPRSGRVAAVNLFHQARRKAQLRSLLNKITGHPDELLVFDEVRRALNLAHPNKRRLDDIPLDAIVGSVDRYYDFNRKFYPLSDSARDRWAKVKELVEVRGLEPIEVYQIGDVYFVLDGNHRVSVARQLESETIEAFVSEFRTNVEITPDDDIRDVILKAEHQELMEDTGLDEFSPDLEFQVTMPGRYREILEHIQVHRYFLGLDYQRDVSFEEAVKSWVDQVYVPAVKVIRDLEILKNFPGRTETDLYLWLKKHQWDLEHSLKYRVGNRDAAKDLRRRFGRKFWPLLARWWRKFWGKSRT